MFVEQLVDSIRRNEFVLGLAVRDISARRSQPDDPMFDPIRAAVHLDSNGEHDEACWLIFLATHFGKHRQDQWRLVGEVYRGDGAGAEWTWQRASRRIERLRQWLDDKNAEWTAAGTKGRFGNHRKYESLNGTGANGTGAALESYIEWVRAAGSHRDLFDRSLAETDHNRHDAFDWLYREMEEVTRFGRLARFDYLCMIAKAGLADIAPGHPYIDSASGPKRGAQRLTGRQGGKFDQPMAELGRALGVDMQVMEDALCNWSKSPARYRRFSG